MHSKDTRLINKVPAENGKLVVWVALDSWLRFAVSIPNTLRRRKGAGILN